MQDSQPPNIAALEIFFERHFEKRSRGLPRDADSLKSAIAYSLHSGGKRFRPQVAFLTADLLGIGLDRVLPHAAAVELMHTYSLIHDDLPCMDDDSYRRGVPTNHVMFGEDTALLAGDALLTEAFYVIGDGYASVPELGLELARLLAEAAGLTGMIAGQAVDLKMARASAELTPAKVEQILDMHERKTGALIRYAAEGVAVLARLPQKEREQVREFGVKFGLAFQIADDLLDFDPRVPEQNGLPARLGVEKTRELLNSVSQDCQSILLNYGGRAGHLVTLVKKNLIRKK